MKNLDLNAYGVEEMNEVEQQTVDGGVTLIVITLNPVHVYVLGKRII